MQRINRQIALGLLALAITGTLAVASPGPIPFSVFDANRDGRVSAEEFYAARGARIAERAGEGRMMRNLGQAPSFESFDTDGDGYLSPMELNAGHAARMAQRPGAGMGPAERAGFADFDRNGDGSVSREEFQQTREQRREMNARLGRPMRNQENAPEFDSFDANGDGVLTPNEFVPGRR